MLFAFIPAFAAAMARAPAPQGGGKTKKTGVMTKTPTVSLSASHCRTRRGQQQQGGRWVEQQRQLASSASNRRRFLLAAKGGKRGGGPKGCQCAAAFSAAQRTATAPKCLSCARSSDREARPAVRIMANRAAAPPHSDTFSTAARQQRGAHLAMIWRSLAGALACPIANLPRIAKLSSHTAGKCFRQTRRVAACRAPSDAYTVRGPTWRPY
jgi:hypothetical protein